MTSVLHLHHKSLVKVAFGQFCDFCASGSGAYGIFSNANKRFEIEIQVSAFKLFSFVPEPTLGFVAVKVVLQDFRWDSGSASSFLNRLAYVSRISSSGNDSCLAP